MTNLEKVNQLLDEIKTFYIVTVDGNKPKARPVSFKMLENGKLYFGLGTFKESFKQLQQNPNVEIIGCVGAKWLRYDGVAHFVLDDAGLEARALDTMPGVKQLYQQNNWHLGLFYLEKAHVEIKNVIQVVEEFDL